LEALDDPLAGRRFHAVALLSENPQPDRPAWAVDRDARTGCAALPRLGLGIHRASILADLHTPAGYWAGDV
jgi:hypothetical protein